MSCTARTFSSTPSALLASISFGQAACHEAGGTYVNVSGHVIHDPRCVPANVHLQGETAICPDGSHSMSEHHRGTCSHHGGVDHFE